MFSQSDRAFQRPADCARVGRNQHRPRAGAADQLAPRPDGAAAVRGRDGFRRAECPLGGGGDRPQTSRPCHPRRRDAADADLSEADGGGGRAGACLARRGCGRRTGWPVAAQCQCHTGGHPRVVEPGQSARRAELLLGHTHHAGVRGTGRTETHRHLARLS